MIADLRAAIAALKAHHRLALVQAYSERAWATEGAESEFFITLAELVADAHNQIGEPKRALLAEVRRIVDGCTLRLNYLTPAEYEARIHHQKAAQAA